MQRSFEVIAGTEPARPPGFTPITSSMDVPRPDVARKKKKRRLIIAAASVLGLIVITVAISRLKPAAMSVDRASVWIDTVKRGPMLRQVRGLGTLVPEDIRWIAAAKDGRVEKIVVRPGAHIEPDTLIVELSSPDLEQAARDAELKEKGADAELTTLRATLQRELLNQESTTAQVHSEYQQAKMEAETNENLKKNGLIADLAYKTSIIKRDELANRDAIEEKRLAFARDSIEPQLAAKQAEVEQLKASTALRAREVEALHVRAGMTGVLQQLPVEVGQRVQALAEDKCNLYNAGSTSGIVPFLVINGPIVRELGIQCGGQLISRGPNPAIGRAVGLIVKNIAGFRPGQNYMGTFGYPLVFTLAEDEELTPWEPFHVEQGFARSANTVTVGVTNNWGPSSEPSPATPQKLWPLSYSMSRCVTNNMTCACAGIKVGSSGPSATARHPALKST